MPLYFQCAQFKSVFTISCHHHLDAPEHIPDPAFLSFPHPAFLQFIFQFAPRSSQGELRGHPVIRCPSDVFTLSVTANTSGAHIQVIPVPLDTFHEIISEVVIVIFAPQLYDRNCWKRVERLALEARLWKLLAGLAGEVPWTTDEAASLGPFQRPEFGKGEDMMKRSGNAPFAFLRTLM
ncbi:hypothetical protein PO909_015193 [Leuciscus waleckii]